jgi:hypothetical protein
MKRTHRSLFVLTTALAVSLVCATSSAQQTQGNVSFPMFKMGYDSNLVSFDHRHAYAGYRAENRPEHISARSPDSASLITNAPINQPVHYFYEPYPMEVGSSFWQIGASVSLAPIPDAEQEIPIPGLDIQYKRGLFENVSLAGSFSTSYFANLFHGGIQWNANQGRFSYGVTNDIGGAYGFITRENLYDKVEAYAFFYMPMLRFGYRFDDFSLSCSLVMSYIFKSTSYVNGLNASVGPEHTINDLYGTLVVEQPFLRNLRLSIGLSLGYARTPYQSWMFYNTLDEWLFVPEFFFAVQL